MTNISIAPYGKYSGGGWANAMEVRVGVLSLRFSYRTVVAFSTPETGLVVCQNEWGTTTGKHLNWIDGGDKKSRLPRAEFLNALTKAMRNHNLEV
jgi:hypothetical protein